MSENLGSDIPKTNIMETAKQAVKNTVDLSLRKPVLTRVRQRMRELRELSSAKHEKEQRGRTAVWHTTPPKRFLAGLDASVSGNIGYITYSEYESKNGNKVMDEKLADFTLPDGKVVKRVSSSEYKLHKQFMETIEFGKPIKVEEYGN